MRAGRLRHLATLQEKVKVSDGAGGNSVDWIESRKLWCDIRPISAAQKFESMRKESSISHEITIRGTEDVTTKNRIMFKGRLFNIDGIRDIDERGIMSVITASEGVAT